MARAVTAPEKAILRSDGQWSRLFLAIQKPAVIYSALVNGAPASNDMVNQINYDGGSGTLANVKDGMTMYVGTSAGARDLGEVRIRKAPTGAIFYFGETSKIQWQDNAYLTVVDRFAIWDRPVRVTGGAQYMDSDIAYGNQHTLFDPVPVLGPHIVTWLAGASVNVDFDASDSWVIGSSIASYAWTAPGSSASSGMATALPTITYNAPGTYPVYCAVTAANGKSFEGVRYVFVYSTASMPATQFKILTDPQANYDEGGYSFQVELFDEAYLNDIRDGALCILFSRDWYGNVEQSIGPVAGRENIICMGYIAGETINWDPETNGSVEFTVQGPQYWLSKNTKFTVDLSMALNTPDAWNVMPGLTVDGALFDILHWRSTVTKVMDVYLTGDTRMTAKIQTTSTSLWQQIMDIAFSKIYARPGCDRYGRLFVEIDPQMVPEAGRAWPVVQTIEEIDWAERINVTRETIPPVSMIFESGEMADIGGSSTTLYSLAPGHVPLPSGEPEAQDGVLVSGQTQANEQAGLYMGWRNNEFPEIQIDLAENNRFIDLWPRQFLNITVLEANTPRGIAHAGNIVPRSITLKIDKEAGALSTSLVCEAETFAAPAIDGDIPASAGGADFDLSAPNLPGLPPLPDFTGLIYLSPTTVPQNRPKKIIIATSLGVIYTENADAEVLSDIVWKAMNNGLDVNDKAQIAQMVVTPSGAIYIMTNGSPVTGYGKVMRAPGLGASWETVFTATDRVYEGATRSVRIIGLGVNRYAADEIGIVDSVEYIAFGANSTGRFYVGSTSFGAGTAFFNKYNYHEAAVVFEANKWFVFSTRPTGIGGSGSTPYVFRFSSAGGAETEANFGTGAGQGLGDYRGVSAAGKLFLWVAVGNQDGYFVANPDLTKTWYDEPTYVMNPEGVQAIAVSPTGTHAMGADDDGPFTPYKSTDSLASWQSVGGVIPIGSDVWENCRDNFRWLFGGGSTGPRLTMDQGGTYIDLSGNLGYIAAARDITHIRFIS